MNKNAFQIGIEIKTQKGPVLKPHEMQIWDLKSENIPSHFKNSNSQKPLKYFTDALLAICFYKMNDFQNLDEKQKKLADEAYYNLNPYSELFKKSSDRLKTIQKNNPQAPQSQLQNNLNKKIEEFENKLTNLWKTTFSSNKIQFSKMLDILNLLNQFEHQIASAYLYNMNFSFKNEFNEKLICFYSFLFHLRGLVAIDHNSHVEDSSIECVKCDSISDYLPKADYTVNDALLYWHFKNLSLPFVGHKDKDPRIEKLFVEPMNHYFNQYNHNACCLIDQLPANYLNTISKTDMEENLHSIQMDWLLGSGSGLLFRIREELFGLTEGYEKIFWPEASVGFVKKPTSLSLAFHLSEKDIQFNESQAS